ncbi:hypothetical protein Nepgr_002421 [Nepenthes gracilis]|uniref:LOB domain-containing protein n=1 Tax=Nepenthes gracilis TaxID=150966 RepID=A0AAD3P705_NEPGR|nr:hypothetical protein Nepgr_002421 [Nepenthes gracilis]
MNTGPCGACKFLRRKCLKGCIFAPYFDSEQGMAHFAAVHKVFGASNAAKLLLGIPSHRRLDAVVTLCYEALARVRDPVYGCVAHIFTLQHQVVNLQAELAYIQARLSTLQRLPLPPPPPSQPQAPSSGTEFHSSADHILPSTSTFPALMPIYEATQSQQTRAAEMVVGFCMSTDDHHGSSLEEDDDNGDLQTLTREFISKYLPGMKFWPSTSQ